jgi:hypothetical protein
MILYGSTTIPPALHGLIYRISGVKDCWHAQTAGTASQKRVSAGYVTSQFSDADALAALFAWENSVI